MRARLTCLVLTSALAAAAALAVPAAATGAEWLAGDLHVHTVFSHDSYGGPTDDNTGPEDLNTLGFRVGEEFAMASVRGLDYLAITDHMDVRSQQDPGFGSAGVIPVPGFENSLKGHAQMLGATRPPCSEEHPPPCYDNGDKSVAAIQRLVEQLHAEPDRGVFQANHPSDPLFEYQYEVPLDTVETWNLPWVYKPPFPSAADNDIALKYWYGWLDRGEKVAMTGASDSHWVITSPAQGPGQPTTWVLAEEHSARGVLEGLRAGHTFVSHQPPNLAGPQVFLEGDGNGDGSYESIVGDTVPPGSRLRVRVVGAAGALLRVVTDGGQEAFPPVPVTSPDFEHSFTLAASSTWAHSQVFGQDLRPQRQTGCVILFGADVTKSTPYCHDQILMLAMSSSIYLGTPAPEADSGAGAGVLRGRARLRGPRGCVRRTLRAAVRGRAIRDVSWFVDGRRLRRVSRPDRHGRFALRAEVRDMRPGEHRLAARVRFTVASQTRARAMGRGFRVCAAARAQPRFTG